jgi:hypothetical protein
VSWIKNTAKYFLIKKDGQSTGQQIVLTQGMTKPAQKAIEYIESIEKLIIPEKDRLMLLFEYYENNGTLIFGNSNNGLKKQIKILEMDGVAHIYKMPKG